MPQLHFISFSLIQDLYIYIYIYIYIYCLLTRLHFLINYEIRSSHGYRFDILIVTSSNVITGKHATNIEKYHSGIRLPGIFYGMQQHVSSFRRHRVREEHNILHPDANTTDNPQSNTFHTKQHCTATTVHRRVKKNSHHCKIRVRDGRQNQDEDTKTREKSTEKCSHENNCYVTS
jgi:hypothetical protein